MRWTVAGDHCSLGRRHSRANALRTAMRKILLVKTSSLGDVVHNLPVVSDIRRVYADAVIVGRVSRFRERVGDEWGAKSPAAVSFVLDLIDVQRGDVIWSARFDETQKSLSENIFAIGEFSQRGGRWLSAEQLMQEGVKKAIGQLHQTLVRAPVS